MNKASWSHFKHFGMKCKLKTLPQDQGHVTSSGLLFAVNHEKLNAKSRGGVLQAQVPWWDWLAAVWAKGRQSWLRV